MRGGVAKPFLDPDGEQRWIAVRFHIIADAVEQYLCGKDEVVGFIPDRDPVEEKPEPLIELERYEFFNWQTMPVYGGMIDQPWYFLEELAAAAEGRARYRLVQMQNQQAGIIGEQPATGLTPIAPSFNLQKYFEDKKTNA